MENIAQIKKDGISVIICCYNSSWIIKRSLEALEKQVIPKGLGWEVVIVDNNSTDNTKLLVNSIIAFSSLNIILVEEKKAGLLNARKKGIKSVSYQYSIFCDDDNIFSENYVYSMYKRMCSDVNIGCIGGRGVPDLLSEPYPEFKQFMGAYALGNQRKNPFLFGAGLCVRTQLVNEIYDSQTFYLVGRCGNKLLAGDDNELVASILLRGYYKIYIDDLVFIHVIKAERLTWDYLKKMFVGFAMAHPIIYTMECVIENRSFCFVLFDIFRSCLMLIKKLPFIYNRTELLYFSYHYNIIKAYRYWGFKRIFKLQRSLPTLKNELSSRC